MPRERMVVIGGVAAGMSAASRARRMNPELEIIVLEKGEHVSYGACGLPYYISGRVVDSNELVVYTADFFRQKRQIDVRLHHEAIEIEPGRKTVHALRGGAEPIAIHYDRLIIATGGTAIRDIPGANLEGVFTCRELRDAIRLRQFLETCKPAKAIIIGSGYLGLELADALAARGIQVMIVERSNSLLEAVEPEIDARIQETLDRHRVEVKRDSAVSSITRTSDGALDVHCPAGSERAGVVILATGLRPRSKLAESSGILLGASGAISTDDRMQTNVSAIYAAGDCAEAHHLVLDKPAYFPLGTTANKQGRVAGENAAGGNARFPGIVGTMVTQVFELEVARTGLSFDQARAGGFDPDSVAIDSISHARYLGGKPIHIKMIWDRPSGRLLGCQMAGEAGVGKRIDVLATALHARMKVSDVAALDLSYAPPFAPVWDPILTAAAEAVKKSRGRFPASFGATAG